MDRELWLKEFIGNQETFEKAKKALEARDMIYELAFNKGPLPMIMLNEDFEFIKVNQKATDLLGEVLYESLDELIDDASVQDFNHYKEALKCKHTDNQVHLWFTIDDKKKYIRMTITTLSDQLYQGILIDESFTKERIEHLEIKGFKDYLTQIYNRRFFHEEIQRLDVQRNYPLGLIIADLNGLKLVNDAFGHNMGDALIKEVASVLKATCRSDDIVARIGGDEFAVIVPLTSTPERAAVFKATKRLSSGTK
jgi:GGDEF domain-containing protein